MFDTVNNYRELRAAADAKKSVTCSNLRIGPLPAAFVLNMNYALVCQMIASGLYTNPKRLPYFKKKKGSKCPK